MTREVRSFSPPCLRGEFFFATPSDSTRGTARAPHPALPHAARGGGIDMCLNGSRAGGQCHRGGAAPARCTNRESAALGGDSGVAVCVTDIPRRRELAADARRALPISPALRGGLALGRWPRWKRADWRRHRVGRAVACLGSSAGSFVGLGRWRPECRWNAGNRPARGAPRGAARARPSPKTAASWACTAASRCAAVSGGLRRCRVRHARNLALQIEQPPEQQRLVGRDLAGRERRPSPARRSPGSSRCVRLDPRAFKYQ